MQKIGVLILNLGTPDSTLVKDVRKYLREFLMDKRVIDVPLFLRFVLVNGIIAPFRAPKSATEYKKIWTPDGLPLKVYGYRLRNKLQNFLGDNYYVELGMRYQNPSIEYALEKLKEKYVKKIIILPLYPQYSSATTGSTLEKVMNVIKKWQIIPEIKMISNYSGNPKFIQSFVENGKRYLSKYAYDHFVFSYHGLPERQIKKASVNNYCKLGNCCNTYGKLNSHCYRAQCFHTSRLIAENLGIGDNYTVCFQSRLGKEPWLKPYITDVVEKLLEKGYKRVLVFSPSFVSDCLETTIELGEVYKGLFEKKGGELWTLVDSLNDNDLWVECLAEMVQS
jgi:ferrochelatase